MLFNIHTLRWDEELLRLFDIPACMLPEVRASAGDFGETDKSLFGEAVPIRSMVGDQQSALFGQLCLEKGEVKNTYGTGCFLLMNTGEKGVKSNNGLVTTLGVSAGGKPCFVLEGSVFVGGAVVQWLRDELGLITSARESEERALKVKDSGGVYVVPAFTGLGAPYWNARARGAIVGITRGTSHNHIIRAALESIAYQVSDLVKAMERDSGIGIRRLAVDGGASANNFLMGFQADILNCETVRPKVLETTALGACYLAGLSAGVFSDVEALKRNSAIDRVFTPVMSEPKREALLKGWAEAIGRVL
jgi:glycerol kinase